MHIHTHEVEQSINFAIALHVHSYVCMYSMQMTDLNSHATHDCVI